MVQRSFGSMALLLFLGAIPARTDALEAQSQSVKVPVWKIARSAAEHQIVSESVKSAIDAVWPELIGGEAATAAEAGAGDSSLSVGGTAVAVYGIAQGIDHLTKAKTDKQKAFATAEVVSGAFTIVVPPAGAAASAWVAVVEITDSIVTIQANAHLADLDAQILEVDRAWIESKNRVLQGDLAAISFYSLMIGRIGTNAEKLALTAHDQCEMSQSSRALSDIQNCLTSSHQVLQAWVSVAQAEEILAIYRFQSQEAVTAMELIGMGPDQLRQEATALRQDVQAKSRELSKAESEFNNSLTAENLRKIQQTHAMSRVEETMFQCDSRLQRFSDRVVVLHNILKSQRSGTKASQITDFLRKQIANGEALESSECFEIQHEDLQSLAGPIQIEADSFLRHRGELEKQLTILKTDVSILRKATQ